MYNKREVRMHIKKIFLLVGCLFFLSSCVGALSGNTIKYLNPDVDFNYIKKIAVLPFNNMTKDKYAGEKVRDALTIDLLSRRAPFEIVEKGEVSKVLSQLFRAAGLSEGTLAGVDAEMLKLVGERLEVQAVILGNVYDLESGGQRAIASLAVRMLDTSSGTILWTAKSEANGTGFVRSILGMKSEDKSILTKRAVKSALDTFF
ncbi:MAG: hypothetical protein KAT46_03025 [Deltaproteobacteria bacterium]|nr:hypothetical protein [Deltaproteobacteria bacterium]